jgi:mono/diheme cytochrome c family protein
MKKVLLLMLALSALTLASCGSSSNSNAIATLATVPPEYAGKTNPFGADVASAGADVFKTNCEACHGPQAHGDGPAGAALDPKPRNLLELAKSVGDDYFFWRISTGKDGTSMVAWRGVLTDEQIWQTVAFIRTLK